MIRLRLKRRKKRARPRKAGRKVRARAGRRGRILKAVNYQTGRSVTLVDRKRKALPPGLRISRTGRRYWETRKNRSDLRGWV
ncbi:MAG: hypothetical protein QW707_06145 [Candidatus Bathyarchaeia archaeon]